MSDQLTPERLFIAAFGRKPNHKELENAREVIASVRNLDGETNEFNVGC